MDDSRLATLAQQAAAARRSPGQVVFFGRQMTQFNDNGKYAFLHCARSCPALSCAFVTESRDVAALLTGAGLAAYVLGDPRADAFMLGAGVVVCDDFHWRMDEVLATLLHPAKVVQLWHGIPLKAIGFPELASRVNMTPEKAAFLTTMYSGYDTVASTSPYFTEHAFAPAFLATCFEEMGYPRNDVLTRAPRRDDMLGVDAVLYGRLVKHKKAGGKVLVVMPTFRDGGGGPIEEGMLDLARLAAFGERHNVMTVLKLHPYVGLRFTGALPPTLAVADAVSDAYPLLRLSDALLTDYSSVYFDYLLTDRPIIFYPYDFDRYVSRDRELLFDYATMTPGPRPTDPEALFAALEAVLARGEDEHAPARQALAKLSFRHVDGHAAVRLGEYIQRRFTDTGGTPPCKP
ncbi:CDP-glycerol glycerophosphotransferase family protein [Desulfovibrio sp. TomC]|uniref:CDP-glycerol glycerophosphotransferase family protein n=1 Tax=Desulfovibrio sp. TomC TaxID=1562888 RepID=UPI0005742BB8|nr:CDP-glycerol glycerophosphotransferase family protein [Desulfovibrio sp. TomC]KHK01086.1 CDP-glycerol:poly(glycerophosphate) glycerophosphotransferase [Desulfovibrio sp. TomC]